MKIYKFTKNTVELSQYYKNIDSIRSIIIIGNTCGLCGWFDMIEDEKWEEMVPRPNIDKTCDAAYENMDVLESLINNKAEIVVVCDCEDTKTYWETVYHYFCVLMDKEEIRNFKMIDSIKENKDYETVMEDIKTKVEKRKHKFDVGFINAPYDNGLHRQFESMMFNLCNDEIVWVGPTNFVKTTAPDNKDNDLRKKMEKHTSTVIDIHGNDYFDAATPTNMGIIHVDLTTNEGVYYNDVNYSSCDDIIHPYELAFKNVIKSLYEKDNVNNHICTIPTSRFKSYINENPDINSFVYKFPRAAGDNHRSIEESQDYYTVVQKGQFTGKLTSIETYDWFIKNDKAFNAYIPMNHFDLCKSLQNYLSGFFARLALKLSKNSYDLMSGSPSKTIPWFDFSDPMFAGSPEDIDVALFRKYGISQQIVDHILEILPNYYNLDLTKYKNILY